MTDDTPTEPTDDDADHNDEPDHDQLDEHTKVKGKYALYTGDRPLNQIQSHWSIREVWASESDDGVDVYLCRESGPNGGQGYYDALRDTSAVEIKSVDIDQSGTSRYVVRRHHHDRLSESDEPWNIREDNRYCIVVSQRLGPRLHHTVDSLTIDMDTMDDILDEYSWVDHGRKGVEQAHVPWTAHYGLAEEYAVKERAQLVRRVYDFLREADHPEAVRDEIRRLTDLMDLLDQHAS